MILNFLLQGDIPEENYLKSNFHFGFNDITNHQELFRGMNRKGFL